VALLGLDYAGGRPRGAAIAAAGYKFVVRYLSPGGSSLPGKLLTPEEYRDLQNNGIAVVANWETTASRMKGGRPAGIADARAALAQVRAVGHPTTRPIYFSADWDATPADQGPIDEYLRGAATIIGAEQVGIYGGYWPVKRALDNGTARWAWQTGAWSGGNVDPRIHIYQRIGYVTVGGVQCDVNEARKEDYGQYLASAPVTTKRGLGMVQNFVLPAGEGLIKLICPTGTGNLVTARAWLSASLAAGEGSMTVWFQRDNEGISQWDQKLVKDSRVFRELPDGTTQMTVKWSAPGPVGLALETLSK
jgi:hypothetical protein